MDRDVRSFVSVKMVPLAIQKMAAAVVLTATLGNFASGLVLLVDMAEIAVGFANALGTRQRLATLWMEAVTALLVNFVTRYYIIIFISSNNYLIKILMIIYLII